MRVERIAGTAPTFAYAVVNDQANGDGSFIPPVLEEPSLSPTSLALPVLVEAGIFSSELVLAENGGLARTLDLRFVAAEVTTADHTARFSLSAGADGQRTIPAFVQYPRGQGIAGIGAPGGLSAALFITVPAGGADGLFARARTSAPGQRMGDGAFVPAEPA